MLHESSRPAILSIAFSDLTVPTRAAIAFAGASPKRSRAMSNSTSIRRSPQHFAKPSSTPSDLHPKLCETERFSQMGGVDASPPPRRQLRAHRGEDTMDHLDPANFKEFGHRHEVLVGRDEHFDVTVMDPAKTDHVGGHPDIDALLLGPAYV